MNHFLIILLAIYGYLSDCTSQALIRCAHACHEARCAARFGVKGIETKEVSCDWQQVKQHIKRLGREKCGVIMFNSQKNVFKVGNPMP